MIIKYIFIINRFIKFIGGGDIKRTRTNTCIYLWVVVISLVQGGDGLIIISGASPRSIGQVEGISHHRRRI